MLNFKNIKKKLKKNEKSIKIYFKYLKFFHIIKIKLNIFNYKFKLLFKYNLIYFNFYINLLKSFIKNDIE